MTQNHDEMEMKGQKEMEMKGHDEMEMKEVKWNDQMMMNELWAEMEGWKWMGGMMKEHFVHAE